MKRLRSDSNLPLRKVACTVSAAALMLGVSEAASIGFNLQVDYCGMSAAYRNNITATAFGIPATSWENLTPMMTGYGDFPCDQPGYTLNEVINTTSSAGGLHPLPNGSLSVNWSAPTANWSFFGGYDRPGPYYDFGGPTVTPGEGEIYAGFTRDGINSGPPGGVDNTSGLPPYQIDITGLKTLFTNTPFVIQLMASSDSMYHLTNAFIIDVTSLTTQSVIYANPSHPKDRNDAPWIRGHGGGLSTVSASLNTDHVKLIGNFPQHSASLDADKTHSINNASCIAGFIITDKPVVTMSPQSVAALPHYSVTLRAIAAGVPPLSYQWRKGGAPISAASGSSYDIPDVTVGGSYDLVVTNIYGTATSKVSVVTVDRLSITRGPGLGTNTITWQAAAAVLQSANAAGGPYLDISPTATSPYLAPVSSTPKFYRYRLPATAGSISSNPYDM